MSKIQVDAIEQQTACGTTLTAGGGAGKTVVVDATTVTLGRCGGTVALASGATQTGFGRTGTVDWDTTPKTATFTGVSGNGYFVNTTGGVVTVNLPASPSAGNIVAVADYAGTSDTNNITVARNGSNINGAAADLTISNENSAITLVYVDGTQGWKATDTSSLNDIVISPGYITATGGTITTSGDYKIHTFTGPGTLSVSNAGNVAGSNTVDYMIVAGGASGGCGRLSATCASGGGGAGGWRASSGTASGSYTAGPGPLTSPVSAVSVTAQGYPIIVGGGGASAASTVANAGSVSSAFGLTSAGGGGGGSGGASQGCANRPGNPGGSGGGLGGGNFPAQSGGLGNTPPVTPPQGNNGGNGTGPGGFGGGGGATAVGGTGTGPAASKAGGAGATSCISASPVAYAGGGGAGGSSQTSAGGPASPCGTGGRGGNHPSESPSSPTSGTSGTTNRGGGGGGMGSACTSATSGAGGSGIVIIRYKFQN